MAVYYQIHIFQVGGNGYTAPEDAAVYLVYVDGRAALVDAVSFRPQQTDVSYGRYPDGTGDFYQLTPTYGAANASP